MFRAPLLIAVVLSCWFSRLLSRCNSQFWFLACPFSCVLAWTLYLYQAYCYCCSQLILLRIGRIRTGRTGSLPRFTRDWDTEPSNGAVLQYEYPGKALQGTRVISNQYAYKYLFTNVAECHTRKQEEVRYSTSTPFYRIKSYGSKKNAYVLLVIGTVPGSSTVYHLYVVVLCGLL